MTDHLKELSERATQGEWKLHGGFIYRDGAHEFNGGIAQFFYRDGDYMENWAQNARFIAALVNAYRSGSLIPADQGRVEELEAENARLKEALRPFAETLVAQVDVDLPQQDWRDEDYDTVVRIRTSHARRGLPDLSEDMTLAVGDFRNARATLSRKGEG